MSLIIAKVVVIIVAILFIAGLIWLFWQFRHAPEGFQDENGFQYGKYPPKEKQ